jgi:hypothetical protein
MQEQLPRTSAPERAMDGLEACLRGQVPRVAADHIAPFLKNHSLQYWLRPHQGSTIYSNITRPFAGQELHEPNHRYP